MGTIHWVFFLMVLLAVNILTKLCCPSVYCLSGLQFIWKSYFSPLVCWGVTWNFLQVFWMLYKYVSIGRYGVLLPSSLTFPKVLPHTLRIDEHSQRSLHQNSPVGAMSFTKFALFLSLVAVFVCLQHRCDYTRGLFRFAAQRKHLWKSALQAAHPSRVLLRPPCCFKLVWTEIRAFRIDQS